jgi:hypothetical protein
MPSSALLNTAVSTSTARHMPRGLHLLKVIWLSSAHSFTPVCFSCSSSQLRSNPTHAIQQISASCCRMQPAVSTATVVQPCPGAFTSSRSSGCCRAQGVSTPTATPRGLHQQQKQQLLQGPRCLNTYSHAQGPSPTAAAVGSLGRGQQAAWGAAQPRASFIA